MGTHIAVLSNPAAGKGRSAHAAEVAVEQLRTMDRGADVRVFVGHSAEESRLLAVEAIADGPAVLVIVGGDGTLSAVLDILCAATIPVALVPAGTGNDFARAMGIPRKDPAVAASLAVRGTPRTIDIGEVRSHGRVAPFLTVAALGFDAKVSDRTNRLRWPRGRLRYYLALLIELARLRPTAFRLSHDGGSDVAAPGILVAVGNTESYGGGMPVCAGALPDDGMLDVVHVAEMSRLRLIRLFPLLLRGLHLARPEVRLRRVRTVTVSAPDLVVYADGERVGEIECTIAVRTAALTVMVPHIQEVSRV